MTEQDVLVRMSGVSKSFGGTRALNNVDFECRAGSVHAILGENGAGKSTLIKVLSGVIAPDSGTLTFDGRERRFETPHAANEAGVVCIFQELSLIPDLTVAENISIANPPRRFGLIDARAQRRQAEELLARVRCEDIDPDAMVRDLSLSRKQMVEISKALAKKPKLLILDEATSALNAHDVETLYDLIGELSRDGVTNLFISHKMYEVEQLCDTLSVFRNGAHIETFSKGAHSDEEIVRLMIGRKVPKDARATSEAVRDEIRLKVEGLCWENRLNGVDMALKKGEIVGLGGLDGQGQHALLLALFGVLKDVEGTIELDGEPASIHSPHEAKTGKVPVALVPEDRKTQGLMLPMSIQDNLMASNYGRVSRNLLINRDLEAELVAECIEKLHIKLGHPGDAVSTLSGGNQQKVVIAKWLATQPDLILLSDPTRGIDVGTKAEIYSLLGELAKAGKTILLFSTDYSELIMCCNRVLVMYGGRIAAELEGEDITEEAIVAASLNIDVKGAAA